eukprot:403373867
MSSLVQAEQQVNNITQYESQQLFKSGNDNTFLQDFHDLIKTDNHLEQGVTPYRKVSITMGALLVFNTFLLFFALYLARRLYKLLRLSDLMMLQTIVFINMIIVIKEVYLVLYILDRNNGEVEISGMVFNIMLLYGNNFYLMAFALTSSKWINFQIMAETQRANDRQQYELRTKKLRYYTNLTNIFICIMCAIILVLMIVYEKSPQKYDMVYSTFLIASFSMGLISLAVVTRKLIVVLRKYYPEFYYQERKFVLSMTLILIISMSCKVLFGIYRLTIPDLGKFFRDSELNDDWNSPLYYIIGFCVSEFLPVTSLLLSFWYGLTRRNKVIKSRKYSNPQSSSGTDTFWDNEASDDEDYFSENPFGIGKDAHINTKIDWRRKTDDDGLTQAKTPPDHQERFLTVSSNGAQFKGPSKNSIHNYQKDLRISGGITNQQLHSRGNSQFNNYGGTTQSFFNRQSANSINE